MKILSVHHTQYPNIDKPVIWEGNRMPKHKYNAMDTELFKRWSLNIHNELLKFRMWDKIISKIKLSDLKQNKVNPGGVAHIEGQESALRLAKEILS